MKFLFVLLCVVSSAAQAGSMPKEDPRFTFSGGKRAFKNARVPNAGEVTGEWMTVGEVADNGGYYVPDGKRDAGDHGEFKDYYRQLVKIEALEPDAFAQTYFRYTESMQIVENGLVGKPYKDFRACLNERGLSFAYYPHKKIGNDGSFQCETQQQCRIVDATGMLLCAFVSTDKKCGGRGEITGISGFMPLP